MTATTQQQLFLAGGARPRPRQNQQLAQTTQVTPTMRSAWM